jgi:hypothetical protein
VIKVKSVTTVYVCFLSSGQSFQGESWCCFCYCNKTWWSR